MPRTRGSGYGSEDSSAASNKSNRSRESRRGPKNGSVEPETSFSTAPPATPRRGGGVRSQSRNHGTSSWVGQASETPGRRASQGSDDDFKMLDNLELVLRKARKSRSLSVASASSTGSRRASREIRVNNGLEVDVHDLSAIAEAEEEAEVVEEEGESDFLEEFLDTDQDELDDTDGEILEVEQANGEDTETSLETPSEDDSIQGMNTRLRIPKVRQPRSRWMVATADHKGWNEEVSSNDEGVRPIADHVVVSQSNGTTHDRNPRTRSAAERLATVPSKSGRQSAPLSGIVPNPEEYPSDDEEVLPPGLDASTAHCKSLCKAFSKHMNEGARYWLRKSMLFWMSVGLAGLVYTAMVCSAGSICTDVGLLKVLLVFFFSYPVEAVCVFGVLLLIFMGLLDFGDGVVRIWSNIGRWSARQKPRTNNDTSLLSFIRWVQRLKRIPWLEIGSDAMNKIWDPMAMLVLTLAFRNLLNEKSLWFALVFRWGACRTDAFKGCLVSASLHMIKWVCHAVEDVYLPIYHGAYPRRRVKRPVFTVVFAFFLAVAIYIHWDLVYFSIPATLRYATAYRHGQGFPRTGNGTILVIGRSPSRWTERAAKGVYRVTTRFVTGAVFPSMTAAHDAEASIN
ncbi:hypothetical protein H2198_005648 [Neophaeococcomyces mojaviensis]|uniref:Uncharacterized protein n=1 Tax=Neophaeococcomyces mojaviensis TaxID=3383035 RepID=A0ACC3A513_9EURO|nr:hypothetical protein H2198_005648 [Knufia sp. JES_112]